MYFEKKDFFKNLKELSYEEFIAGHYKLDGYDISLNKKNLYSGIDIICFKDDILIMIQCINLKNKNRNKITDESLKVFLDSCNSYIQENKLFNKTVEIKYISSDYILDDVSSKLLKLHKFLDFEVIRKN